ncbi:pyridoxal phosphate enzyme (YggS family) [Arcanobacterium wilhelmae]|uniref:Pyridoxal phosphate homeostasis protein n=1 Tax=Arcanobacterium wilhelmae TaxID=1803177 RepID=A0ABT9N9K9_9ACTO|nr:YggS family pyridoxal phosphate-dependent enzyme [Arcanobacterium wilhelmae]MDP9800390.1 pyridoxal phosphate enzyme (YggS family) [Arcanobacterium wilhelmae]WFN89821.1 YggS family pyridoxal phosphate-dependent enzyme [Arcanobacterium wilhelmae]
MSIPDNISVVRERIAAAEAVAGRDTGSVVLQLAAKYQPVTALLEALEAGVTDFGHNMIQQLVEAETGLSDAHAPRHSTTVIGHVQSNKLATAMEYATRIDTVDSVKIAERIARRQGVRIAEGTAKGPYSVLLQINASGAQSQFGIEPDTARAVAEKIAAISLVRVDGLMTIGAHTDDERAIARSFAATRALLEDMHSDGTVAGNVLSMGMTSDLEIAIAEGSTLVRVGTAVFGPRPRA